MEKIIEAFKSRNINCYFVDDEEEAVSKILELIPKSSKVSFGGSITLEEIGILNILKDRADINLLDRTSLKDPKDITKLCRESFSCDVYLSGTNAITKSGQIVNVDGKGNRVAAITFGPDKVIIVVGRNKITDNLDDALERIKKVCCVKNIKRLESLGKKGWTVDNMWCTVSIIERQKEKDRIHIIIVNKELGF
ncbi:MAG: lactate utilization protein [Nanoarchaeota archaeon]|nr:lactate utilization protein [Nanoarchaeota archaeon]